MRADILNICELLNSLGSRDPTIMSPLELKIPGLETADSVALEESLRGVIHRVQELEQKVTEAAAINQVRQLNTRPVDPATWTPPEDATPQRETATTLNCFVIISSNSV
jgi:hypothetical protein